MSSNLAEKLLFNYEIPSLQKKLQIAFLFAKFQSHLFIQMSIKTMKQVNFSVNILISNYTLHILKSLKQEDIHQKITRKKIS